MKQDGRIWRKIRGRKNNTLQLDGNEEKKKEKKRQRERKTAIVKCDCSTELVE